jgi:hypothetical protein
VYIQYTTMINFSSKKKEQNETKHIRRRRRMIISVLVEGAELFDISKTSLKSSANAGINSAP